MAHPHQFIQRHPGHCLAQGFQPLDGFAATAAAAVLYATDQHALDHCVVGHVSAEPGHRLLIERINQRPLFDFGMRLGQTQNGLDLMGSMRPALESARTIGDYYRYASAHMYVYSSAVDLHLEPLDHERYLVRFHMNAEDIVYRRQLMEQLLSINRKDAIALSGGKVRPREIWFSHARIAPQSAYDRGFGAPVRF